MSLQQTFIANLRYFRKKKGLTQKDLSIYLNKGYNYINCIEGGNSFPPPAVIDQIAQVLGIDPGQLPCFLKVQSHAPGYQRAKSAASENGNGLSFHRYLPRRRIRPVRQQGKPLEFVPVCRYKGRTEAV